MRRLREERTLAKVPFFKVNKQKFVKIENLEKFSKKLKPC